MREFRIEMSVDGAVALRLTVFLGLLGMLVIAEAVWPLRTDQDRRVRWPANLGLAIFNSGLLRLLTMLLPGLPVLAAMYGESPDGGWWGRALAGFFLLDLAVYAQHVLFHHVPLLWRVHRVHHADTGFDVTTGIRFHPVEMIVSQCWKSVVVVLAGVPVIVVVLFEITLNASSMFSHANLSLGKWADRLLRSIVVTPDMHRVHHSTEMDETNSNFGFNFSIWDRLFGTYRSGARADQSVMRFGLGSYQSPRGFLWLLKFPFAGGPKA